MLGHKTSLSKFLKTDILPNIFFDHNGMKLDITNKREENWKTHKYVEIKQTHMNKQQVKDQIKREFKKKILKQTKMETQ